MVTKRSARAARTQTTGQARALVLTGPDDLRLRFCAHTPAGLVAELAALRPRPGAPVGYPARIALRELGRRAQFLSRQLERLDELMVPLVTARAPGCSPCTALAPTLTAMATQTREQGRYLGGRPPYGYRLADAGPHPNKAHAAWG